MGWSPLLPSGLRRDDRRGFFCESPVASSLDPFQFVRSCLQWNGWEANSGTLETLLLGHDGSVSVLMSLVSYN